jgi:DNA-binding LacI/PurR family transcriptional regulator
MGTEAALMLLDQLQRPGSRPKRVTVQVEFMRRGSTVPPR